MTRLLVVLEQVHGVALHLLISTHRHQCDGVGLPQNVVLKLVVIICLNHQVFARPRLLLDVLKQEDVVEARRLAGVVLHGRFELMIIIREGEEWILLAHGVALVLEELCLDHFDLDLAVIIYLGENGRVGLAAHQLS